jgi:hypothetical protein
MRVLQGHLSLALGAVLLLAGMNRALAQRTDGTAAFPSAKLSALAIAGTVRDSNGAEIVAHAIYVKLRPGTSGDAATTVLSLASQAGLSAAEATPFAFSTLPPEKKFGAQIESMPADRRERIRTAEEDISRIVELYYTIDLSPVEAAQRMMKLPQVAYAEPIPLDLPLGPVIPNDPFVNLQWQLEQIRALEAWDIWQGDTSMTVAIVDIGIDNTHEDLAPNIRENPGEAGTDANGLDKRTNGMDDDGNGVIDDWKGANLTAFDDNTTPGSTRGSSHGTQVSGYAAAMTNNGIGIAGIANRCRLYPIKAGLFIPGRELMTRGYQGLIYAAHQGFKVANLSWGSPSYSQVNQDIINDLVAAYDIAIVAAGGNDPLYGPRYPAGYRHVLGVGAVDTSDTFRTTWGEQIDVSAPSGFTTSDGNQYWGLDNATSYTAPVATGVVALVRSRWTNLSADQALAHVRLTADNVDSLAPTKAKLVGYGRVNAYRALSIDPFSHPAVIVDSLWLVDQNGAGKVGFRLGERGTIRFRLKNLLGDVQNLRVTVRAYTGDSVSVSLDTAAIAIAELKSTMTTTPDGGIPFEIKLPNEQLMRLRFVFSAPGYDDYGYEQTLMYKPFITTESHKLKVSLTDRGHIGFEDYPTNRVGDGIVYDSLSFAYEGGLMIASDAAHVLSNVRGDNSDVQDRDFTPVELPSTTNDSTLVLNDSGVETARRIGVELRMQTFTRDTVPGAVGIRLRTRNISGATIDTLRVAMFTDWDLADDDQDQRIAYVQPTEGPVAYYGRITGPAPYAVAQGVAAPSALPIFYALNNGAPPTDIYYHFERYKKWITLSSGVGSASAGPDDISLVIGKRIAALAPDAEDTTIFVIGVAPTSQQAADAIRRLLATSAPASAVAESNEAGAPLLGAPLPNPFARTTSFTVRANHTASLRVTDIYGRTVADLSDQLPGIAGATTVRFDASALPSGVYHVQLVYGTTTVSRQLVVVR